MNFNPKIKIALILAGGLVIVSFVLLLLTGEKTKPTPETTTINIPAFQRELNPPPAEAEISPALQQTINIYRLSNIDRARLQNFFQPVANDLDITSATEAIEIDGQPHLFWANSPNFLTVNTLSGTFIVDWHEHPPTGAKISEADSLLFSRNWLNKYQLIKDNWLVTTEYFADIDGETIPQKNSVGADVYLFSFSPTIDGLPIFNTQTTEKTAPVSVMIDAFGNILSVNYQLPSLFFAEQLTTETNQQTVLTSQQIEQSIAAGKPVITAITFLNGNFAPSNSKIANLSYRQTTLGYSNDITAGYFVPVFQLAGSGTLESGESVIVTAYLSALAQ